MNSIIRIQRHITSTCSFIASFLMICHIDIAVLEMMKFAQVIDQSSGKIRVIHFVYDGLCSDNGLMDCSENSRKIY